MAEDAARPNTIERMNYLSFDTAITLRYGVVCEHYPLDYFCGPGGIPNIAALRVLFNSWHSGTTKFRRLSEAEYNAWMKEYEARAQAGLLPAPHAPVSSTTTVPVPPLPMGVSRGVFTLQSTAASAQPIVTQSQASPSPFPRLTEPELTATQLEPTVVQPADAPSQPADGPAQPADILAQPTDAPAQPTGTPAQPTDTPVQPTAASVQPADVPAQSQAATVQSTAAPSAPTRTHTAAFGGDGDRAAPTKRKRRDAGIKRGPNIRTLRKQQSQAAPSGS